MATSDLSTLLVATLEQGGELSPSGGFGSGTAGMAALLAGT